MLGMQGDRKVNQECGSGLVRNGQLDIGVEAMYILHQCGGYQLWARPRPSAASSGSRNTIIVQVFVGLNAFAGSPHKNFDTTPWLLMYALIFPDINSQVHLTPYKTNTRNRLGIEFTHVCHSQQLSSAITNFKVAVSASGTV